MSVETSPEIACVVRTRSAVLNALIVSGTGIALSGILLRWRDGWAETRAPQALGTYLLIALFGVVAASHLTRRRLCSRVSLIEPSTRLERFYHGHVRSAFLACLAVPLGLAYGWWIRPRLDSVAPFWIAAVALGFLSLPRLSELEDFDEPLDTDGPLIS